MHLSHLPEDSSHIFISLENQKHKENYESFHYPISHLIEALRVSVHQLFLIYSTNCIYVLILNIRMKT